MWNCGYVIIVRVNGTELLFLVVILQCCLSHHWKFYQPEAHKFLFNLLEVSCYSSFHSEIFSLMLFSFLGMEPGASWSFLHALLELILLFKFNLLT